MNSDDPVHKIQTSDWFQFKESQNLSTPTYVISAEAYIKKRTLVKRPTTYSRPSTDKNHINIMFNDKTSTCAKRSANNELSSSPHPSRKVKYKRLHIWLRKKSSNDYLTIKWFCSRHAEGSWFHSHSIPDGTDLSLKSMIILSIWKVSLSTKKTARTHKHQPSLHTLNVRLPTTYKAANPMWTSELLN